MNETEEAAARLAVIVANFAAVNRMAPEAVGALDGLFDQIKAPEELRAFWDDRIAQGKRLAEVTA